MSKLLSETPTVTVIELSTHVGIYDRNNSNVLTAVIVVLSSSKAVNSIVILLPVNADTSALGKPLTSNSHVT